MKTKELLHPGKKSKQVSDLKRQIINDVSGMSHPSQTSRRHHTAFNGRMTSTRRQLRRKSLNHVTQSQQALAKRIKAGRESLGARVTHQQKDIPAHLLSLKIEHRHLDGGAGAINLMRTTGRDAYGTYLIVSIEVPVPLDAAYDAWNKSPDFPHFMKRTQEIDQFDGSGMTWRVHTPAGPFVWRAAACDQQPCTFITWKSLRGVPHPNFGSVNFDPISNYKTSILVQIGFEVDGLEGCTGDPLPALTFTLERCLLRLHNIIEHQISGGEISDPCLLTEAGALQPAG
jgi:hypothetical protein